MSNSASRPTLHNSPLQSEVHWRDLGLFYEYFHAETGQGLGACHHTGWTGLMANLVMRRYRRDIPVFWKAAAPENR